MMNKLLIILLLSFPLLAQQKQPVSSLQEDCGVTADFTAISSGAQAAGTTTAGSTGTTAVIDNRLTGCLDWMVVYSSTTAVTALSLTFQTALDIAGTPTTWSSYPGTLVSGINPNTAATTGGAVTEGTGVKYPFLRMNLTALTGAGTVHVRLYGWKRRPTNVNVVAGICPGTIATPCVVVGPGAAGAAIVGSPVRVGGMDVAGLTSNLRLGAFGAIAPASVSVAQSDGVSNTIQQWRSIEEAGGTLGSAIDRSFSFQFNGSTWDRPFICTNQALFNLSGSGNTQIIAASGSTTIRICHISFSTTAAEDFNLTRGTGANCGTGTADVTGLYKTVSAMALDFQPTAALRGAASGAICLNQSAVQATGGIVIYAQF